MKLASEEEVRRVLAAKTDHECLQVISILVRYIIGILHRTFLGSYTVTPMCSIIGLARARMLNCMFAGGFNGHHHP